MVAGVAFQVLGYLDLRVIATILAAIALAVLGWLAQRVKLANDKRQSWNDRSFVLQNALAVWPPRRAEAIADRAFDAGLYPITLEAGATDVPRSDDEVALQSGEIVLIVGPAGSGKSEFALDLLQHQAPNAWLVVPEDAEGLASLLSLDPPFGIAPDQSAVLLLDGCERFLPALRLGPLDDLRARGLSVVATVREDELNKLLRLESETGYVARRLVARARTVHLAPAKPNGARSSLEKHPAGDLVTAQLRRRGTPLIAAPVSSDVGSAEEAPFLPAAPPPVGRDWGVRVLAAGALALAGGFAAVWLGVGLTQPPPIAAQLAALTNAADRCGSRFVHAPVSADAISSDRPVVVVTRDAGRCHAHRESDELSVFVPSAGRLTQVYAFQPADGVGGEYEFRCSGTMTGDACLTNIVGTSTYAITGAFTNTNTLVSYPIEIVRTGDRFSAAPLQQPPPPRHHQSAAATTLTDGSTSVAVMPTTAYSVVQPLAGQPPVYVVGRISSGSFDSPRALRLSAWSPTVGGAQPSFDHECRPLASSKTVEISFVGGSGDFVADLGSLLGRYWTRIAKNDGESCP